MKCFAMSILRVVLSKPINRFHVYVVPVRIASKGGAGVACEDLTRTKLGVLDVVPAVGFKGPRSAVGSNWCLGGSC